MISEEIRSLFLKDRLDLITELLLVLASRRQNITRLIMPAIEGGKVVVIDRFFDSTLVYQGMVGGMGVETVRKMMELSDTLMRPDITIILDLDTAEALGRKGPEKNRFDHMGMEYHQEIRKGFLSLAPLPGHYIIDASRDQAVVNDDIVSVLEDCGVLSGL